MGVRRLDGDFIALDSTYDGKAESLVVSEFNAWRIFGAMSLILGIPLSKAAGKAIKFDGASGEPATMRFSRNLPPDAPLGQRLAAHLVDEKVVEKLKEQGYDVERVSAARGSGEAGGGT